MHKDTTSAKGGEKVPGLELGGSDSDSSDDDVGFVVESLVSPRSGEDESEGEDGGSVPVTPPLFLHVSQSLCDKEGRPLQQQRQTPLPAHHKPLTTCISE